MAPDIQRLAVTPRPREDESLPSYLLRLVEANGLKAPSWLCVRLKGGELRQKVSLNFGVSQLSRLTGWSPDALAMFELERANAVEGSASRVVRGVNGGRGTRNLFTPMFCPLCVEEFGYISNCWDAEPVVACPLHGIYGITHCRKCGEPLSWERPRLRYCYCGERISNATELEQADEIDLALAELVASTASGYLGPGVADRLGFPTQVLRSQTPAVLLRTLDILARFIEGVNGSAIYGAAPRLSYRAVLEVLRCWPENFKAFINGAIAHGQQDEVHRLLFHHSSGVFCKPNKEKPELKECLDMIADAVYEAINSGDPWAIDRRVREAVFKGREFRWMTATDYAHSLGISTRRLKQLESEGQVSLTSFKWGATKSKALVVQTGTEVESSLARISMPGVAKKLGLPVGVVKRILERGWFPTVSAYSGHGLTDRAFMALELGLNDIARAQRDRSQMKADSARSLKRLGDVLHSSRIKVTAKVQLIDRVRAGSLTVTGPAEMLVDLVVDTLEFGDEVLAHARPGGRSGWVYAEHVVEVLDCSLETVGALLKEGYLTRLNGDKRLMCVSLASIYRFRKKFVSCRELGELLGASSRGARDSVLKAFPKTKLLHFGRIHTPFLGRKGLPTAERMCEILLQG
jgi:hypothetical protein